jgi:hypothetical protein
MGGERTRCCWLLTAKNDFLRCVGFSKAHHRKKSDREKQSDIFLLLCACRDRELPITCVLQEQLPKATELGDDMTSAATKGAALLCSVSGIISHSHSPTQAPGHARERSTHQQAARYVWHLLPAAVRGPQLQPERQRRRLRAAVRQDGESLGVHVTVH